MTKETQTDQVDLPEDDPETVKLLVRYLYEGEYDPFLPSAATQSTTLAVVTPVRHGYTTSKSPSFPHTCQGSGFDGYTCKYGQLCPHYRCSSDCDFKCREFTCETCVIPNLIGPSSQLLTHVKMYEMPDKYEVIGLKELAKEKFSRSCKHFWGTLHFPIAARHAFSTTPEKDNGLRDCVSRTIAMNMQLIRQPMIRTMLMKFNGLALGILDAKSKELGWDKMLRLRINRTLGRRNC
ncbi:BTB/POZ domain-containing protein [Paraphaeosphaeria sporulosa]